MANRDNHYEAAFEAFLRSRGIPYVAVDEAKRSVLSDGGSIKSLDFIVSSPGPYTWLVDVKGRRFPSGDEQKQYWKNWSTRDDLKSLAQWEQLFGSSFRGLFVFAYDVLGDRAPLPADEMFEFRDSLYGFVAVTLDVYSTYAHPISPRWDTLAMPTADFRRTARPVTEWLGLSPPLAHPPGEPIHDGTCEYPESEYLESGCPEVEETNAVDVSTKDENEEKQISEEDSEDVF